MIVKLLILHFLADFVLQTREMGTKKSSDVRWLGAHLAIMFLVFFPFTSIWFALLNCAVHGVIDWYIWRGYKWIVNQRIIKYLKDLGVYGVNPDLNDVCFRLAYEKNVNEWKFWEDHLFFTTIGLDQVLHGITLVVLAGWLL